MPVPTRTQPAATRTTSQSEGKNIWIAAGEGDLERVKHLVDVEGISPIAADEFTYTPLHAAASYGHVDILRFLLSHASTPDGAANTTDEDGDTPLFVCENEETARVLIDEFGADPKWKNNEGETPASQAFENEHEDLAAYLRSLTGEPDPSLADGDEDDDEDEDDDDDDQSSEVEPTDSGVADVRAAVTANEEADADERAEAQTDALMEKVGEIIERHKQAGTDPENELRDIVGEVVVRQIMEGLEISSSSRNEA